MRFRFRNASSKFQIQSNTAAIELVSESLPDVVKYTPGVSDSTQLPSDHGGLEAGSGDYCSSIKGQDHDRDVRPYTKPCGVD